LLTEYAAECKNSAQCAPAKHHFDECVERVQQQESEGGAKEDCVEECKYPIRNGPMQTPEKRITDLTIQSSTSPTALPPALPPSFGLSSSKHTRPANTEPSMRDDDGCRNEARVSSRGVLVRSAFSWMQELCWRTGRPFLYHTLQRPKIDFSSHDLSCVLFWLLRDLFALGRGVNVA
jgi:hypothetical protein